MIPALETMIPYAGWHGQKMKKLEKFDLFKKFIRDYSLRTGREKQKQLWGSVLCFQPWTQHLRKMKQGNSLVVRRLGLGAFTTGALGSTPGQGTKILQVTQWDQKENPCGPTIM